MSEPRTDASLKSAPQSVSERTNQDQDLADSTHVNDVRFWHDSSSAAAAFQSARVSLVASTFFMGWARSTGNLPFQ